MKGMIANTLLLGQRVANNPFFLDIAQKSVSSLTLAKRFVPFQLAVDGWLPHLKVVKGLVPESQQELIEKNIKDELKREGPCCAPHSESFQHFLFRLHYPPILSSRANPLGEKSAKEFLSSMTFHLETTGVSNHAAFLAGIETYFAFVSGNLAINLEPYIGVGGRIHFINHSHLDFSHASDLFSVASSMGVKERHANLHAQVGAKTLDLLFLKLYESCRDSQ